MTKPKRTKKRVQFDLDPGTLKMLDDIAQQVTSFTRAEALREIIYFAREHIERVQQGYRRFYMKPGNPNEVVQVESKLDRTAYIN